VFRKPQLLQKLVAIETGQHSASNSGIGHTHTHTHTHTQTFIGSNYLCSLF